MKPHDEEGYIKYPDAVKRFGSFSTHIAGRFYTMADRHDRLRQARLSAGFERQRDVLAIHPDWNKNSYKSNENGNAPFSFEQAKIYAKAFGVRAEWLYDGSGPMSDKRSKPGIPIIGYVSAGNAEFADDYTIGQAYDYLEPLSEDGRICLRVSGDSMLPRFRPGELLVFGMRQDDPESLIGREVMAATADGKRLIKVLRRGSARGKWSLFSINTSYDPIEDVELLWVLPFEELRASWKIP